MKIDVSPVNGAWILAMFLVACSSEPDPGSDGAAGTPSGQAGSTPIGGSSSAGSGQGGASAGTPGTAGTPSAGAAQAGSATGGASAGSGQGGASAGSSQGGASAGAAGMSGGVGGASAGSGGKGGAGGSGGSTSAGAGGGGAKSAGCGKTTTQMPNQWVSGMVTTGGGERPFAVRLPLNYDPMRAYPVIVLLHGCGNETNNVNMESLTKSDAILVRGKGSASGTCWDASPKGSDMLFFDAMVAATKERYCADTGRFFVAGYSSGSWLANQIGCIRTDVIRAAGSVAGGDPGHQGVTCMGPMARIFVHDRGDMSNVISGSVAARTRMLTQNGCDANAQPVAEDPSPCVRYQGCKAGYPVVWCETTGEGHNRQDNLAGPAFWNFFKEF